MVSDWGIEINFWNVLVFLLVSLGVAIVAVLLLRTLRPGSESLRRFQGRLAGPTTKKCPFCAEMVMAEARVCKHCGRDMISSPSDVCAECLRALPSGSSRCPHCHARV